MPVFEIRALPQPADVDPTAVMKKLCTTVAAAIDLAPHHLWATWQTLTPGHYVEGDAPAAAQRTDTHPPIVRLVSFEGKSADTIEKMLAVAADVLATELRLEPGNVFITYDEASSGRVYTGGQIVRRENYERDSS